MGCFKSLDGFELPVYSKLIILTQKTEPYPKWAFTHQHRVRSCRLEIHGWIVLLVPFLICSSLSHSSLPLSVLQLHVFKAAPIHAHTHTHSCTCIFIHSQNPWENARHRPAWVHQQLQCTCCKWHVNRSNKCTGYAFMVVTSICFKSPVWGLKHFLLEPKQLM